MTTRPRRMQTELERLRLLEEISDPATIRRLERTSVRAGWSCLEVAAGGGSIAAWLGNRFGSGGRVMAVDIDTRFLGGAPHQAGARMVMPEASAYLPARAAIDHWVGIVRAEQDPGSGIGVLTVGRQC